MSGPPDTTDDVLQVGVDRALWHIRHGRPLDARFALEVAMWAAVRIDGGTP